MDRASQVDSRLLTERIAEEAWRDQAPIAGLRPRPVRPILVMTAGVPLSGKSSVARALIREAPTAIVHAENDALRESAAAIMGRPREHDASENYVTYQSAWTLVARALDEGMSAVHDATNLRESGRRKAYQVAEERGADVYVVFVVAETPVLEERAKILSPDRQEAYQKHLGKEPNPDTCTKPHLVLSGARSLEDNLKILQRAEGLHPLWEPDRDDEATR